MFIPNYMFCFRQIALKALSERLSKSHALDKHPLLPKTNKVVMPPSLTHGAGSVPSTSAVPQAIVAPIPVPVVPVPTAVVTPSQRNTFTPIQPNPWRKREGN